MCWKFPDFHKENFDLYIDNILETQTNNSRDKIPNISELIRSDHLNSGEKSGLI